MKHLCNQSFKFEKIIKGLGGEKKSKEFLNEEMKEFKMLNKIKKKKRSQ